MPTLDELKALVAILNRVPPISPAEGLWVQGFVSRLEQAVVQQSALTATATGETRAAGAAG